MEVVSLTFTLISLSSWPELAEANTASSSSSSSKSQAAKKPRHTLTLKEKYDVIDTAKKNPGFGARALASKFSCGKTQITTILCNKDSIVNLYESNMSSTSLIVIQEKK